MGHKEKEAMIYTTFMQISTTACPCLTWCFSSKKSQNKVEKIHERSLKFPTSLEIPERKQAGNFAKLFDTPLKFQGQKLKPKTHRNSTWVFLEHPWKFQFFFNWPLEFPHVLSSTPLEIPCPQPPLLCCIV